MDTACHSPAIDAQSIRTWCSNVLGYLDGNIPIRRIAEKGTPDQKIISDFVPVEKVPEFLISIAGDAASRKQAVFVIPASVGSSRKAGAQDIVETAVALVDLDEGEISLKRNHLVQHLGEPTLEVASGGKTADGQAKRHLFWRLTEAATKDDLRRVEALRQLVALKVGSDPSVARLHQPIRVAGTVHGKNGVQSPVVVLASSSREYELSDLETAAGQMPALHAKPVDFNIDTGWPKGPSAEDLMTRIIREGGQDGETRFGALSKVIGHWIRMIRKRQVTLTGAWLAVTEYNAARIDPPWDETRLRKEFEALLRKDIAKNGPLPADEPDADDGEDLQVPKPPKLSEDDLAHRFRRLHHNSWKFVAVWGAWYRWNGLKWDKDELGAAHEIVRLVCREGSIEADKPSQASRLASARTIAAVLKIAASDPVMAEAPTSFDSHPMLLNTLTGVLDLETGALLAHQPDLLITQITAASPGIKCPRWLAFLNQITAGDRDLIAYLARVAGYCLTGKTSEQVFFFLFGPGANGKSVFLQTIAHVLGDYAATAASDTFTARGVTRHQTEIAGLRAARMVLVSETESGTAWAEARIKTVTGGDKLRANFMYHDMFEFTPQFKLLVAGNSRPALTAGEAMRRRLHVIPFTVTIPAEERDPGLLEALKAEADGILGWMIEGCADWQVQGLKPPPSVVAASDDYIDGEDTVGQWIEECCRTGPNCNATARALFKSWQGWAEGHGFEARSSKHLGEQLRSRGFGPAKVAGQRGWQGLALVHRGGEEP